MNNIPESKRIEMIEIVGGIEIKDPYRWLENGSSSEVKEWTNQQNEYLASRLKNEVFNTISDELVKNFKVVNFSNPSPTRGKYFYSERQKDEDQAAMYVKEGLNGNPVKLVDPNGTTPENTSTIDFWSVSWSGKYMAYGLSQGGDEMATLYLKDIEKNENMALQIPRCRYSAVRWLPDDSGFFYTRNSREGEVPENEAHLHNKVYFHRIEENDYNNDELIFGKDRPKDDMLGLSSVSPDGRYLGIQVSLSWTDNEIYIYDRETKKLKSLVTGIPSKFSIFFLEEKAVIDTNYKANNYRLLTTPLSELFKPIDDWEELLPEREYLLQTRVVTKSKLIVEYLINATSKVFIFDHTGKELGELPLPSYSTLAGISSSREEEEFFYGVETFTFPKITYRYKPETDTPEIYRKTDNPINPDDYVVKQEWFVSKDGTKVPMFIFHKKDLSLSEPNPTILYGYGGFGHTDAPGFLRSYVPWMERGGIFALANIRGNGEFGEEWHKQGIKENKQNTFDDFIAAAEYLIEQGYTDKEHLGIMGGSNGGLLTAAVAVQRPDLFKAVCSRVPLTDMVRFPLFGIASRWVHEYGNPQRKEDLEKILQWSPYHNVKEGVEYPATLFTTGIKDTRVDPLHARKMAALLQSVNKKNPVYIFTEMEAGHGPGKPIRKIVESFAIQLTFFAEKLGLKI